MSRVVRGQPLVALLAVLGGWIGGRVAVWEPPELGQAAVASELPLPGKARGQSPFVFDSAVGPQSLPGAGLAEHPVDLPPTYSAGAPHQYASPPTGLPSSGWRRATRLALWDPANHAWGPTARGFAPWYAPQEESFPEAGLIAPDYPGYPPLPSLSDLAAQPSPPSAVGPGIGIVMPPQVEQKGPRRWSADVWMLKRRGGGTLASGPLPATYGASQTGAVLRYRLAPGSRYRPTAYLRTTSTLGAAQETSAALGVSGRPVPSLPVIAAVEARMTDYAGTRRFQPAVMAVTELPPFELPLGMRGEAYGQAGYVGGRFATPFADGQFRFDRELLRYGRIDARLGGGVWGGVQKGAGRLDVGPSAAVTMPLGRRMFGRMALDWRFRVVGNAQPQSGPAVTLSAGF